MDAQAIIDTLTPLGLPPLREERAAVEAAVKEKRTIGRAGAGGGGCRPEGRAGTR